MDIKSFRGYYPRMTGISPFFRFPCRKQNDVIVTYFTIIIIIIYLLHGTQQFTVQFKPFDQQCGKNNSIQNSSTLSLILTASVKLMG